MGERSANDYRELREAAQRFRDAYRAYLDALLQSRDDPELRRRYNELIPAADEAMHVAGRVPGIAPPPMLGGGPYQHGLAAVTTGVEQWHGDPQLIFDALDQTIATLRQWETRPPTPSEPRTEPAMPAAAPDDGRRRITITLPTLDRTEKIVSIIVGLAALAGILYGAARALGVV